MKSILIADENPESRRVMADLCMEAGYSVTVTHSAAGVINGILKKTAAVLLLGSCFDELSATELIPLLKKCCRNLNIILVSNEATVATMRKLRTEGIFYHLLRPVMQEDREEFKQVVACALNQPISCYC